MRTAPVRRGAGAALLAAVALATAASAAPAPLVLTDPAGDANGADLGPGPGSQGSKDIVSLRLARLPGTTCTGYTAVIELAAPPADNSHYRVRGTTRVNSEAFWASYSTNPLTGTRTSLKASDGDLGDNTGFALVTPAKVAGTTITITVLERDLEAVGEKAADLAISGVSGEARTHSGLVVAPQWDRTREAAKPFRPCG